MRRPQLVDAIRMQPSIDAIMTSLDGVAHLQDLLAHGYTRHQVAAMARQGRLIRPRIGWYVAPWLEADAIRAIRVGGRLACISAARSFGLATPADARLHVALDEHSSRHRASTNGFRNVGAGEDRLVVRHWVNGLSDAGGVRFRVGLGDALEQVASCVDAEWAVGVLDSAFHAGLVTPPLMDRLQQATSTSRLLSLVDGRAESILESILRQRLSTARVHWRSQVTIGPYRADFVIGDWLIIEADGSQHGTEQQFASDRERDRYFVGNGYVVLRFTYRQIVDSWPQTLRAILAAMNQRVSQ